ncbi:MGMT family protein [Candidatus Woesearchaeota archaeon]|nr:MGMT family protein [Candidatus Woesearchaeota archaeon]
MDFNTRVWELCKRIPEGKVSTYKELARALGTVAYRAVGNALNRNPRGGWTTEGPEMIPCHRVVNSDGRVGGFARGTRKKIELLEKEGVRVSDGRVDLKKHLFSF